MLPVSDAFLAAVTSSHRIVSRARIITPGATGADPPGVDLTVIDGTVTLDAAADVRAVLDLTVIDPWPDGATTAELAPYGTELAISRGIVFGNGRIERAPLGIYRVATVEQEDAPDGALRITAGDRMAGIVDARLLAPASYLSSQSVGDVVEDLVTAVYPGAVIEWDSGSGATLGRTAVVEEDRYAFLDDLVTSRGKVWFWDYRGVLVIRDPPDPATPVWQVAAGAGGTLVSASRARTREGVNNAVAATGEALDDAPPPAGYAYDLDPDSPTYWLGSFGQVPRFFSSPFITTTEQAESAAASILAQSVGLPYQVDFTAVPNPALEPRDVIALVYPPPAAEEIHILDRITIPLSAAAALTASTRQQATGGIT